MQEDVSNNRKKRILISVFGLISLLLMIVGVTYATFEYTSRGEQLNTIRTARITMSYNADSNGIDVTDAIPMEDSDGMKITDPKYMFDFTVNIDMPVKKAIQYEITAVKQADSTLSNNDVRLYLERSTDNNNWNAVGTPNAYVPMTEEDEFGAQPGEMSLHVDNVSETKMYYYRLRMWVSNNFDISDVVKVFTVKVNVYGKDGVSIRHTDNTGANLPELIGDMIPVIYKDNNWVKASLNEKWYDYGSQEWANAVTIKDTTKRAKYKKDDPGTVIPVDDMNTMWVWIPRYSYTLGNKYGYKIDGASEPSKQTPGAFDIKFINKGTLDIGSGQYVGNKVANYYTPSSFCWGDTCDTSRSDAGNKELSGIWISKFEITGTYNTTEISEITSLPNKDSIRNKTHSVFFYAIQSLMNNKDSTNKGTNNYGFSGSYDAHMMKPVEWGAQAYLTQSKYGKYGNINFSGPNKEVYINNYYNGTKTQTGCSAGKPGLSTTQIATTTTTNTTGASTTTCYEYNVSGNGTGASTTGNITGIYDTSGGVWEKMMGNFQNKTGSLGFTLPSKKYYNLYMEENKGIKGDATNVDGTSGFYDDYTSFVNNSGTWSASGGAWKHGSLSGSFNYFSDGGLAYNDTGSRMVIVAAS